MQSAASILGTNTFECEILVVVKALTGSFLLETNFYFSDGREEGYYDTAFKP